MVNQVFLAHQGCTVRHKPSISDLSHHTGLGLALLDPCPACIYMQLRNLKPQTLFAQSAGRVMRRGRRCETKDKGQRHGAARPVESPPNACIAIPAEAQILTTLLLTQINTPSSLVAPLRYGFPCRFSIVPLYVAIFSVIRVILEDSL